MALGRFRAGSLRVPLTLLTAWSPAFTPESSFLLIWRMAGASSLEMWARSVGEGSPAQAEKGGLRGWSEGAYIKEESYS